MLTAYLHQAVSQAEVGITPPLTEACSMCPETFGRTKTMPGQERSLSGQESIGLCAKAMIPFLF